MAERHVITLIEFCAIAMAERLVAEAAELLELENLKLGVEARHLSDLLSDYSQEHGARFVDYLEALPEETEF